MVDSMNLGEILTATGGFGWFQFMIIAFVDVFAICHAWSLLAMVFGGAVPDYNCVDPPVINNSNISVCEGGNGTVCNKFGFSPDMRTIVSEFSLVCGREWITQTITTIQFVGMVIGSLFWGHICDIFGRKTTFFCAFGILAVGNLTAYFSVSWQMFAALRFLIGFGTSAMNQSGVAFELIKNKWRYWISALPMWPVMSGLLAVFCWKVHDWRYIHLTAGAVAVLAFTGWKLIPESFRWLAARGRFEEAEAIVRRMAAMNGKPMPDMSHIREALKEEKRLADQEKSQKIHTLVDLFRSRDLCIMTLLFSTIWFSGLFSYFGILFDVPRLSGNLYLNMFLVNVVDLPGNITVAIVNIKLGRKWTTFSLTGLGGILALVVGVLQFLSVENSKTTQTVLILGAKFFSNAGFIATAIWILESYPTVIRHIGRGFIDTIGRVGALAAPQFITLSLSTPGLLYVVCGVIMLLSSLACLPLEETKDKDITDLLPIKNHQKREETFS